jgi:hypothetical protein
MTTRSAGLAPARGVDWRWLESAVHTAWRTCRDWPCEQGGADGNWTAMPRVATHTPAPASHAIAAARSFTFQTMAKWAVTDRADDVAAVVTELLTNAIKHALPQAQLAAGPLSSWPIKVGLLHPGSHVICAIADPSTKLPELRAPDWQDESGRGLLVVSALSDHWGCCPAPDAQGKVVWSAFATTARPY